LIFNENIFYYPLFLSEVCYTTIMDLTPHALNTILETVRDQVRCPQCGSRIPIEFSSVKVTGDDFILLEIKCASCSAFMVLQINTKVGALAEVTTSPSLSNISSTLTMSEADLAALKQSLAESGGSFEKMFGGK
jgi:hypothetical protein